MHLLSDRRATPRDRPWNREEVAALADAVRHAPSVHNTQPWVLSVDGRSATLRQRPTPELVRQDPYGRDRRISCGAAVANLVIAARGLGWSAEVAWESNDSDGGATVTGVRWQAPTAVDRARWEAIPRRASFRRTFEGRPVAQETREALASASTIEATWVPRSDRVHAVARLLAYAARVNRDDVQYQRELAVWTARRKDESGEGMARSALGVAGLPAAGLVAAGTPLPDEERLAFWLGRESVLVFSTEADGPRDQMRAGEAVQRVWLEATRFGLAASVMTQPLRLSEVRAGLRDELGLEGIPQLLMRLGYPSTIPVPRSIRRPLTDVLEQ